MSEREALVADAMPAMRDLIRDTLRAVGYQVTGVGTAQDLASRVHHEDFLLARTALVVLGAAWSQQCSVPISVAASRRWQAQLPPLKVILVHEWGTLGMLKQPALGHCEVVALLEKPFDMGDLEQVARLALAQVA